MSNRKEQIEGILGCVSTLDLQELKKLLSEAPPHNASEFVDDMVAGQEDAPLSLQTSNKSFPYLSIYRDLELDKDQNPIYSFRFVSNYFQPGERDIYHGSFGADEVLEVLQEMTNSKAKKVKTPRAEPSAQLPFEL